MKSDRKKTIAITCFLAVAIAVFTLNSGGIFQRGNPLPYIGKMLALNGNHSYAKVFDDGNVYITRSTDNDDLIRYIENTYGVAFTEQMGSAYFFSSVDHSIVAETEVYWRNYRVWELAIRAPATYDMDLTMPDSTPIPSLPPLSGVPIEDARELADAFIHALNAGHDFTGNESGMDSWRAMFDFEAMPVYRGGVSEEEYSENSYQFDVVGKNHNDDVISITVYVNLQKQEPWFPCPYTRYYPYARPVAEHYISLLAEGDVSKLAVWLSVDGGPEPFDDLVEQAERGLALYGAYDLHTAKVTAIAYDNDVRRFLCKAEDAQGGSFTIVLSYGDGLIMPERLTSSSRWRI